MSSINLSGLFSATGSVVIPKIQRDYAEGRETDSVKKKRESLLGDILAVVYGHKEALSLDFVYGILNNNTFQPLDGQQRLTTLFLLHWLFGRNNIISDGNGHSLFVYETRKTSEEFCHWLVKKASRDIIEGWVEQVKHAEKNNKNNKEKWETIKNHKGVVDKIANRLAFPLIHVPCLFDHFAELEDFRWEWHIDPNIHSMIIVLQTACRIIFSLGETLETGIGKNDNLDKISFEILSTLKCDGDVLFEKMNARGKALSSFDLLKSSLEEELERQRLEIADDWRRHIDNNWIDYCWQNCSIPSSPALDDVKKVEEKLERLLIRFMGKSLFVSDIKYIRTSNNVAPGEVLESSIYKDCDNVADNYFKYVRHGIQCGNEALTSIPLNTVYEEINSMLYQDGTRWRDISQYLHTNGLKMHPNNDSTLLDDFTANSLNHDTRVIFYAMIAYLKYVKAVDIVGNDYEFSNFKEWMRFSRNIFTAANKNVRIDKPILVKNALTAINQWVAEFFKNNNTRNKGTEMLNFIIEYIASHPNNQEKARINEEVIKAKLKIFSRDWQKAIEEAEDNPYLWGQIIAPLAWSYKEAFTKIEECDNDLFDIDKFKAYVKKLDVLFTDHNDDIKVLKACVSSSDYRLNGNESWGSLGISNDDRDISWKRHLRDDRDGEYGVLLKPIIDNWIDNFDSVSRSQYLDSVIRNNLNNLNISNWRYLICKLSDNQLKRLFSVAQSNARYICEENGRIYIYKAKQLRIDAIRYELLTLYLYVMLGDDVEKYIDHYNGSGGAHIEFTYGANHITLSCNPSGNYEFSNNTYKSSGDIFMVQREFQKLKMNIL